MTKQKKLIIGNWKMNPRTITEARKIFTAISKESSDFKKTDIVMCPSAIFLGDLTKGISSSKFSFGAQNMHFEKEGAFTGEISPKMLISLKAKYVILGHSERRDLGESSEFISKKVYSALEEGLNVVLCVGEKERDEECTFLQILKIQIEQSLLNVPENMLSKLVIAYEPVWAIGTNAKSVVDAPTLLETILFIRKVLSGIYSRPMALSLRVLYGGSVNENNAGLFLSEGGASGLLIGRASVDVKKFIQILKIADKI